MTESMRKQLAALREGLVRQREYIDMAMKADIGNRPDGLSEKRAITDPLLMAIGEAELHKWLALAIINEARKLP